MMSNKEILDEVFDANESITELFIIKNRLDKLMSHLKTPISCDDGIILEKLRSIYLELRIIEENFEEIERVTRKRVTA